MKSNIFKVLGIITSFTLLWWIFRNQNFNELWFAILSTKKCYLILGILLILPSFMMRGYRWQLLFPSEDKPLWGNLFSAMMIGYLANNVLPARAGEFVRAYILGKKENIPKSLVFATVIVERITDLLITLILLALIVLVFPFPPWLISGGISFGIIGISSFVVLLALNLYGKKLVRWIKNSLSFFPEKIVNSIESVALGFITGVATLRQSNILFRYFFFTIVIWLIETLMVWSLAQSFNLPLKVHGALFIMLLIGISSLVPLSPGNVGTYEFVATSALGFLKITGVSALGFVLLLHTFTFFGASSVGIFCLLKTSIRTKKIITNSEKIDGQWSL